MGGPVMDLLDCAEDHRAWRAGSTGSPGAQDLAVLYLGEPLFDRHEFAVWAGGHVAAGQYAGKRVLRLSMMAQE